MFNATARGLKIDEPEDGALVSGLYFEGCAWDYDSCCVTEQKSKQLFSKVPIIWLRPKEVHPQIAETLKEKVTVYDNASVSTRRQAPSTSAAGNNVRAIRSEAGNIAKARAHGTNATSDSVDASHNNYTDVAAHGDHHTEDATTRAETHYMCPLYRTTARSGTLLTTGHSTNFIIMVNTPMPRDAAEAADTLSHKTRKASERCSVNHWVKRGAAMVCSLSE